MYRADVTIRDSIVTLKRNPGTTKHCGKMRQEIDPMSGIEPRGVDQIYAMQDVGVSQVIRHCAYKLSE